VRPRLVPTTQLLEALAEREVRVRSGRIELEHPFEGRPRRLVLTRVEVRPTERLEDRRLARLQPIGSLEHDRSLSVVVRGEQRLATLEQVIRGLLLGLVADLVVHGRIVARS
jgi:hypothetical protein